MNAGVSRDLRRIEKQQSRLRWLTEGAKYFENGNMSDPIDDERLFCRPFLTSTTDLENARHARLIAQFVRGSHILTAMAVGCYFIAAIFSGVAHIEANPPSSDIKLARPVEVKSPEIAALQSSLSQLGADIATIAGNWLPRIPSIPSAPKLNS